MYKPDCELQRCIEEVPLWSFFPLLHCVCNSTPPYEPVPSLARVHFFLLPSRSFILPSFHAPFLPFPRPVIYISALLDSHRHILPPPRLYFPRVSG